MPSENWLMFFLGMVTFIVLEHNVPVLRQLNSKTTSLRLENTHLKPENTHLRLENIEGIDLQSLSIARSKGLL